LGVYFDGSVKKGQGRREITCLRLCILTQGVRLQCIKGWRGHLRKANIVLLHVTQRFSEPSTHFRSQPAERIENIVFALRLCFFARQQFSAGAIDSPEDEVISSPDQGDRAIQGYCAIGSLTRRPSCFWGKWGIRLLTHHPQSPMDLFL
jgi:hypothetical protein